MAVRTGTALVASDDERVIREAVGGIARSYGPDFYQQQVDDDGNCAALWKALGDNGYLGVHLPEEYGGGGLGLRELAIAVEETAISGCPMQSMLYSPGVVGTVLARSANDEQKARWLPEMPPGDCGSVLRSPNQTRVPTPTGSRRRRRATVTTTSCAARRCSSPVWNRRTG